MLGLFDELIVPALKTYLSALPELHRGRGILPNISFVKLARRGGFNFIEDVIHASLLQFMIGTGQRDLEFEATLQTLQAVAFRCKTQPPQNIDAFSGCTPVMASAVENLCDRWESYSTKSRSYSIFSLFEELIVPAWATYASTLPEHHLGRDISLVKMAQLYGFDVIEKFVHLSIRMFMNAEIYDPEFVETLDTILVVAEACKTKPPKKQPRYGALANRLFNNYCEFCGAHTELAAKNNGESQAGFENDSMARLSAKYCSTHRPKNFLDGSRNHEYLWAVRHKLEFKIELKRLNCQSNFMAKPNAGTGDANLDQFYFKLLAHLPVYSTDICFLRNEARQIVDLRVNDKKKQIIMMRAAKYSLAKIADEVGANSRQAIGKAISSVPKKFRFDLASQTTNSNKINNLMHLVGATAVLDEDSTVQSHFIKLLGPAASVAFQNSDILDVFSDPNGKLWSNSRTLGIMEIGTIVSLDAEKIIDFAIHNFRHEQSSKKQTPKVVLAFANARFYGALPPFIDKPVFAIRKGTFQP